MGFKGINVLILYKKNVHVSSICEDVANGCTELP